MNLKNIVKKNWNVINKRAKLKLAMFVMTGIAYAPVANSINNYDSVGNDYIIQKNMFKEKQNSFFVKLSYNYVKK